MLRSMLPVNDTERRIVLSSIRGLKASIMKSVRRDFDRYKHERIYQDYYSGGVEARQGKLDSCD